jgi:hypothetical protein
MRVTGVTYRLVIDPVSFSRTTASAVSMAGSMSSSRGITAGTMAGRLLTSGL